MRQLLNSVLQRAGYLSEHRARISSGVLEAMGGTLKKAAAAA
jgi:hypothetical protein